MEAAATAHTAVRPNETTTMMIVIISIIKAVLAAEVIAEKNMGL